MAEPKDPSSTKPYTPPARETTRPIRPATGRTPAVTPKISETTRPTEKITDMTRPTAQMPRDSFRETTRPYRIHIAREAEHKFELNVTWGAVCGGTSVTFTPGGSGRRQTAEDESEAKKVMIHGRRRAARAWARRFGFGGPPAWRRGPWQPWRGDYQSF